MNYESKTKDELLALIEERRANGETIDGKQSDSKADLIAALQLSDGTPAPDVETLRPANDDLPSNIPRVEEQDDAPPETHRKMPADSDYKGRYKNTRDGLVYSLAVDNSDERGRTHKARNNRFFWEGSEAEFFAIFRKE